MEPIASSYSPNKQTRSLTRPRQTRTFVYRLIARDTVEEKVLELQTTKRDLAAAIISEDNSPLRNLQREDLELLLS